MSSAPIVAMYIGLCPASVAIASLVASYLQYVNPSAQRHRDHCSLGLFSSYVSCDQEKLPLGKNEMLRVGNIPTSPVVRDPRQKHHGDENIRFYPHMSFSYFGYVVCAQSDHSNERQAQLQCFSLRYIIIFHFYTYCKHLETSPTTHSFRIERVG